MLVWDIQISLQIKWDKTWASVCGCMEMLFTRNRKCGMNKGKLLVVWWAASYMERATFKDNFKFSPLMKVDWWDDRDSLVSTMCSIFTLWCTLYIWDLLLVQEPWYHIYDSIQDFHLKTWRLKSMSIITKLISSVYLLHKDLIWMETRSQTGKSSTKSQNMYASNWEHGWKVVEMCVNLVFGTRKRDEIICKNHS